MKCTSFRANTAFGDCKKLDHGYFADEEMGHILDMAQSLMRRMLGLCDRFISLTANDSSFQTWCNQLSIINDEAGGWKQYFALLKATKDELGYVNPTVANTKLKSLLEWDVINCLRG